VGRTRPTGAGTRFRYVALPSRGPAGEARRLEGIHTRVGGPRAVIGRILIARAALRGAPAMRRCECEAVGRTCPARARTRLRYVALARRGAAREGARLEGVYARVAGPRAVIGRVVVARAALRGARAARRARLEHVGRTRPARARTGLRHVALARRGAARERA